MAEYSAIRQAGKTIRNLFLSLKEENIAGLAPVLIVVLVLAVILVFLKLSAPIAPFVYSLF